MCFRRLRRPVWPGTIACSFTRYAKEETLEAGEPSPILPTNLQHLPVRTPEEVSAGYNAEIRFYARPDKQRGPRWRVGLTGSVSDLSKSACQYLTDPRLRPRFLSTVERCNTPRGRTCSAASDHPQRRPLHPRTGKTVARR